jgi:hypothetical protein
MSLFDDGTSRVALRGALEVCARNGAGPGSDGVTVSEFARRAEHELGALHDGTRCVIPMGEVMARG